MTRDPRLLLCELWFRFYYGCHRPPHDYETKRSWASWRERDNDNNNNIIMSRVLIQTLWNELTTLKWPRHGIQRDSGPSYYR